MAANPSKNDPNPDWPEEVKKAYDHLKIPSLYEAVIANEKLSLEIRRQGRELKNIAEGVQQISIQMADLLKGVDDGEEGAFKEFIVESHPDHLHEDRNFNLTDLEVELLEENQNILEQQFQDMLMDTHDEMRELSRMSRQLIQQVLALIPKKEGIIPREPVWHSIVEQIFQNLLESIDKSRYQLLMRLNQVDIKQVEPSIGDSVNLSLHNVVDRISGGKEGTIARVVQVGYVQNQEALRLADVTIYQP